MDGELNVQKIVTKTEDKKDTGETQTTTAHLEGHIETPNGEICPVKMTVEAPADGFRGLFTSESEFKIQLYKAIALLEDELKQSQSKSVHEIHMEFVKKLVDRGEVILQPKSKDEIGSIRGYIKSENPRRHAGAIFQDDDGTFGLFGDMGALHITGIKWEDLGLCDARCWYEWMDEKTKK